MPKIVKNGKEYSGVPIECVTAWQPTGDPVQVAEPLMGKTDISDIGDGTITGAIGAVLLKVYYGLSTFGEVGGNVDSEVGIHQLPSDLNEIVAIIPYGYVPNRTWETKLVFTGVRINGAQSRIDIRVNGTTSQTYAVKYMLLYR